jgi:tetratricopeptide (TPR) repeat protein
MALMEMVSSATAVHTAIESLSADLEQLKTRLADQGEPARVQAIADAMADDKRKFDVLRAIAESLSSVKNPWDEVYQFRDLSIAHDRIGRTLVAQSKFDDAIKSFRLRAAILDSILDPTIAPFPAYRGAPAITLLSADLTAALQADLAAVRNTLCWRLAGVGRLLEALAECNGSLKLRPNDAHTLDSRGFTYLKMGEFDKAIVDYDAALRLDPMIAHSNYGRGLAKRKIGDSAGGDADIAAARAINADIAEEFERNGLK